MKRFLYGYFYVLVLGVVAACHSTQQPDKEVVSSKKKLIALQPFIGTNPLYVTWVHTAIQDFYDVDVLVLSEIQAPTTAFIQLKTPRYRADSLLVYLWNRCPKIATHILAIAPFDISTTKRGADGAIKQPITKYTDFGIYGLGYCPGKSCIISYHRLVHQKQQHTRTRIVKVALHELGHNFGLPHCADTMCLMQDAKESIKTIDKAALVLCEMCKKQLKKAQ